MDDLRIDSTGDMVERLALILLALLSLALLLPRPIATWDDLGISITVILGIALVSFAILGPPTPSAPGSRSPMLEMAPIFILFAVTPFLSGLGTNNPIFGQLVFSATFWAVGCGVALTLIWERSQSRLRLLRIAPLLLGVVVTAGASFSVAGDVFVHPYAGGDPYFTQKTTTSIPQLRGIELSKDDARRADWIWSVAQRHNASTSPATSMGSPGELLAFNGSGWTNPWIGPYSYPAVGRSCGNGVPKTLFVLQPGSEKPGSTNYDAMVAGLKSCGMSFPSDFKVDDRYADPVPSGRVTVWELR